MKVLVVAATEIEIQPFLSRFLIENSTISYRNHELSFLLTGVGMIATAYSLGKELNINNYDLALNAGIAGSFDSLLDIGTVVKVAEDHFSELGAENGDQFLTINELGLGESKISPLKTTISLLDLKSVIGITVNTVHGNKNSIAATVKRLNPQIESMEGAAFFFACNDVGLPSIQLRAISNWVEERNKANWNINLAVQNLNKRLIELIETL
jgi:futalosine hydrolase